MRFKKQFPSLKGEGLCHLDYNCLNREDGVFIRKDIEKYCIDKQRVKEAIIECFARYDEFNVERELMIKLGLSERQKEGLR